MIACPDNRSLTARRAPAMIDLLITYDVEGWAFHRRAEALARHAPDDFRVRIARLHTEGLTPENRREAVAEALGDIPPDVVFVLGYHEARGVRRAIRERGWPTRLVVGWNNGWPNRREDLEKAFGPADLVIFNNLDCHDRADRPEPSVVLPNGVDLDTFRIQTPIEARPRRVIWCGSERQRKLKGHDELVVPLFERLRSEGIDCEALLVDAADRERRDAAAMAAWYDSATVLVVASETEGTPNVALEAAACGCTLVSTRVGNMPELVRDGENGFLVERDLESLYHGVRRALADYPRLAANLARDIRAWGWPERVRGFFDAFRRVVAPAPALEGDARPDRSDELTVFVSTVGAPSFPECLACLERQDCRFRLEVIANVAPMSAAFQAMMDRCRTPYYIQVDEDMLLRPHAVRTLGDRIKAARPEVALVVAWLWDDHLDRYRQGVKAFRHAVVSRYPFADVQSCEKDQVRRMAADGHPIMGPPERSPDRDDRGVLGVECGPSDPSSAFERYATLEQRRVRNPNKLAWFAPYAVEFLRRFREDPSEMNLMSLLGVLAGRRTAADEPLGEKDFRTYDSLPGLREALAFRSGCRAPLAPPATIVMPLRSQRDEWLRVAVESALAQTVPAEVIVVPSPFTPMSNRAVLAMAAANPRLVVVERPDGAGFADAINLGIRRARADRVGLLLTDDWLSPEAVERCLAEDADIVSTGMVSYAADGVRVLRRRVADPERYARLGTNEERASYLKHFLLFRREAVLAAGGVDPTIGLTGADDYDLPWTLLDRGATVRLVPEPLYHYRDHDAERLTLRDREAQVKDLRKVLAKHGVVGDEAERLVREKSRWYGVPGHVAIVDPEWHLAGGAGGDRRPVDGAIARTMVELGRRPVRTTCLPSGGWHIECANDIAFRARLVEPARAERIARLAALAKGVPLAPLVACRDGVVVERWISGPSFEEAIDDRSLAERVGRLFGGLSASAAGHREFRPLRRAIEPLLVDLDARLARLVANGDLDGAVAERLAARARSNAPDRVSAGLVHVDDQPSSVVSGPDGPVLVGNHHLEVGLPDRHLARIWGRWPMGRAARTQFLRGYGSVRSTRRFLLHELFWAIDTLVAAAADSAGDLLRRHVAALEVLAAGELPSDWRSPPANDRGPPVRVAFLCDWLSIGGQERNALETIRGLDRRRFSPFLYAFRGGSMEPSFRALGIPMVIGSERDPTPGEARDWNAAAMIESKTYRASLASYLARDRIDAAVVFGYRHAAWALQAAGVPVAIERLDGPNLIDHVSDKGRFDRIVAQSVTLRDVTAERAGELGIEAERVEVVFPGVDLARFDPSRVDRDAARASLGFAVDELVVGTVGRLAPVKNIGSLLEAFAVMPTLGPRDRVRLLVVGPDLGELGRLTASAASLGVADRVVFVPGTDDVPRHLAAMDLFVMTSRSEGIPSALLEAMAMGLPAVTTGCGSIPEVIGGNALVLDDVEPGRLARAISRLLARPGLRRSMGGRARSIAARFAVRHSVGRYERMILECLRNKGYPPSHESAH